MKINITEQREVEVATPAEVADLQSQIDNLALRVEALEQTPPIPPDPGLGVNTIFWDDFSAPEDEGWVAVPVAVPTSIGKPSRWDKYRCLSSRQYFEEGAGRDGSAAYVIELDYPRTQIEIGSLHKEFPETLHLHLRTWVKLSEGFQFGSPEATGSLFWKWYRLHQSPWTRGLTPPFGTNGEDNSNFIVGTTVGPYLSHTCCWRTHSGNSSGGPQVVYKNRPPSGDHDSYRLPFGDFDPATNRFANCQWVQIDITHRLGDMDQDNGDLIIWINGEIQAPPFNVQYPAYGGVPPKNDGKLCTNPRSHYGNPPGWNSFSFFDNESNLTLGWTEQHKFYCDSVYLFDGIPSDLEVVL